MQHQILEIANQHKPKTDLARLPGDIKGSPCHHTVGCNIPAQQQIDTAAVREGHPAVKSHSSDIRLLNTCPRVCLKPF
jgi:hypothetical protein